MSTTEEQENARLIERWFPVAAVDEACGTPAGSGRNEKAIFTWFASRPIAQARAAVLCSLLPDTDEEGSPEVRRLVEDVVRTGNEDSLAALAALIPDVDGHRPVVLDCFSGRGIIPLEAARLGLRSAGTDLSPVATLASRLLADWPLRDWSSEPAVAFGDEAEPPPPQEHDTLFAQGDKEPKLLRDLRCLFGEVGRRLSVATVSQYPSNPDGSQPWGYLWAITIPCDECTHRFPLVGSLVLRHPYDATNDPGQSFRIAADASTGTWSVVVHDGVPDGRPTHAAAEGRRGKSARCPFCGHLHPTESVKAKGFAGQYQDVPLAAADLATVAATNAQGRVRQVERKVFRILRPEEVDAALNVELATAAPFGELPAAPTEQIAPGNKDSVRGTGYGFTTWASLMNDRQTLLFIETAKAIHSCRDDMVSAGMSDAYAAALASYATANLVRRLRYSTRGARMRGHGDTNGKCQNRNQIGDLFANESAVGFAFDWFETGPGDGPGTWASLTETTLTPLKAHLGGLTKLAEPGKFRRASATSLPYRDGSVDAIVCDPPYYSMIDYADISDLFYVWARRCLFDVVPDLFGVAGDSLGLQDKSQEIIVKRGPLGDHRTSDWYETQLAAAFLEMRRVLKERGSLSVVFGHSDPDAWRRLLGALRRSGFVVTSAWPARTESANTGVASIKVTVTIGCRVAPSQRPTAIASQVEREIAELVRKRVKKWDAWGLALSDQLMAAYGPAMQVVGRYRSIPRPDGTEPDLDHFLTIGRRAVISAHAFKVDELPLDTFDPMTRFAIFWLRAFKRELVAKGEAVFQAQSSQLRLEDLRPHILAESRGGYVLTVDAPPALNERSPAIHVARALAVAWGAGATEDAATALVKAQRTPADAHVWATVAELVRQLPTSDKVGMALTACQRNRRAIEAAARDGASIPDQDTLPFQNAGEQP
jgi:adenine-specific DNA methylase